MGEEDEREKEIGVDSAVMRFIDCSLHKVAFFSPSHGKCIPTGDGTIA